MNGAISFSRRLVWSFVDRWMEEFRWNPVKEGRLGILFRRQMQPKKMKDRLGLELQRTCNPKKGIVGKKTSQKNPMA